MNKKLLFKVIFIISLLFNAGLLFYIGYDYYKNKRNKDIFKLNAYAWLNGSIKAPEPEEKRVVFIGNSITENWVHLHYSFFRDNGYINRGLGGQTTPLLLLRFRQDVIELKPKVVVINGGINDIAENTGEYDITFTMDNIKSMAELAESNNIKVIISSVLPCSGYGFKGHIKDVPGKIDELNELIKNYAASKGFYYLDYNTFMRDSEGGMKSELTFDYLHPNEKGYEVMEPLVKEAIDRVIDQN
ncbi:MAG: GDSL-type esterase/lipase family protein [Dysgonomonas sp.]|nr:GDSL-type esterase/lipase family protein [Dysgonomonas sp.]